MGDNDRKAMNEFLSSLQLKGDIFMKQLIIERKRVADLDNAISESKKQIDKYREKTKQSAIGVLNLHRFTKNPAYQRADGWNPTKAADALQRKQVRILEERLNKLKIRNSETDNYNADLKHEVDDLRKSRMVISSTHNKYDRWMRDLRQKILDTLKDATDANERRDKAVDSRNALIMHNTSERNIFEDEYIKMGNEIDRQNQLFEESIHQAAKQLEASLKNAMKPGGDEDSLDAGNSVSIEKYTRLNEQKVNNEKKRDEGMQKEFEVEKWKSKFESLLLNTGIGSIDELMTIFSRKETETFSLFNYIQSISQELEEIENAHASLLKEIETYKDSQNAADNERKKILDSYTERLNKTEEANNNADYGQKVATASVEKVAKKVQSLFFKIQLHQSNQGTDSSEMKKKDGKKNGMDGNGGGSDGKGNAKAENRKQHNPEQVAEMTLTGQNVNETNILDYLRVIEKRLIQILNEYSLKVIKGDAESEFKLMDEESKRALVTERIKAMTGGPSHPKQEIGEVTTMYHNVMKREEELSESFRAVSPPLCENPTILEEVMEGRETETEEKEEQEHKPSDMAKGVIEETSKWAGIDADDNIAAINSDINQYKASLWGQKLPALDIPGGK